MIKKLLSVLMSLSLGSSIEAMREEKLFIVELSKRVSFTLSVDFADQRIRINSSDSDLDVKLEVLSKLDLNKVEKYRLSIDSFDGTATKPLFVDTEIKGVFEFLDAMLSSLMILNNGQRVIELNENSELGLVHVQERKVLLFNQRHFHTKVFKKVQAYECELESLLKEFTAFYEVMEEVFPRATLDEGFLQSPLIIKEALQLKSKPLQLSIVDFFLNAQSCFYTNRCKTANSVQKQLMQKDFYAFEKGALSKLLLGLDLRLSEELYHTHILVELFYVYFEKAENEVILQRVVKRLESFLSNPVDNEKNYKQFILMLNKITDSVKTQSIKDELTYLKETLEARSFEGNEEEDTPTSKLEKSRKILNLLITSDDKDLIAQTDFNYHVLLTSDKEALDFTKIDFHLYYQLFTRSLLGDEKYFYTHRSSTFEFLLENYESQFIQALNKSVSESQVFKEKLFEYFKWCWMRPHNDDEYAYKLMVSVEEASKYTDEKELEAAIKKRFIEIRQTRKDEIVEDETSLIRWYYVRARDKERTVAEFIEGTSKAAKESRYPKEHAYRHARYTTKLMIAQMQEGNFVKANQLLNNYINNILPFSGLDKKSSDVASNGLVLAILSKDEIVAQKVFDEVLGTDFKIDKIDNEVLLFNLSCYYAIHNEKEKMLFSVKQALLHGKKEEEFLSDSDFKDYLDDKDFLLLFKSP